MDEFRPGLFLCFLAIDQGEINMKERSTTLSGIFPFTIRQGSEVGSPSRLYEADCSPMAAGTAGILEVSRRSLSLTACPPTMAPPGSSSIQTGICQNQDFFYSENGARNAAPATESVDNQCWSCC